MNLYHVTLTERVKSIKRSGLRRFMPSNWVRAGDRSRYGNGEIYAFTHEDDAVRWAGRMEWELFQSCGDGKVSIVEFEQTGQWDTDDSDPLSQASKAGLWLKSLLPVPAENIIGARKVTTHMIRCTVARLQSLGAMNLAVRP